jgi:hypothetical protein
MDKRNNTVLGAPFRNILVRLAILGLFCSGSLNCAGPIVVAYPAVSISGKSFCDIGVTVRNIKIYHNNEFT